MSKQLVLRAVSDFAGNEINSNSFSCKLYSSTNVGVFHSSPKCPWSCVIKHMQPTSEKGKYF